MKKPILLLLFLLFVSKFSAQNITVSGKATDEKGLSIPGLSVNAVQSKASTISDFDGNFQIQVPEGELLEFSYIGYETQTLPATLSMTIVMKQSNIKLDEVVVIGYGTRKKVDNTGAISQVTGNDIARQKMLNPVQAMQGKAAGVQIVANDSPGGSSSLIIRGVGTVNSSSGPLYVVDGIPTGSITSINPNDILTIDVLKDASSLAIYGNRAANGVIIVTTKKGKGGRTVFEAESYVGLRMPLKKVEMGNSAQFVAYSNQALNSNTFAQNQPYDTDWFDEITRTGMYTTNNLSMSGSTDKLSYLTSVSSYDEKGILNGLDYNRLTFRTNNEYTVSDRFKLSQTMSVSFTRSTPKPFSAFTSAYKQSPILPVRYPDGKYSASIVGSNGLPEEIGSVFNNVGNPVADLDFFTEKQKDLILQGSLSGEYKIAKYLKFTSRIGVEYDNWKAFSFVPLRDIFLAANPTREIADYPSASAINTLTTSRRDYFNWNFDNFFTFNEVFADIHDIEVTVGTTAEVIGGKEELSATGRNVPANSDNWNLNLSSDPGNVTVNHKIESDKKLNSYFGRFQYKLMNRYLVTGTLRRDGSSQFQEGHKWGNFPSFGLGWIVSNEDFLSGNKYINLLKLRGGWGRLGNANVTLNRQAFDTGTSLGYPFDGGLQSGTTSNEKIELNNWETTEETTIGLDFALLTNRLSGTIDVYDKTTIDAFLRFAPALSTGLDPTIGQIGNISNKGYELTLRWDGTISDNFKYWIGGNYSVNKNELVKITNPLYEKSTGGDLGNGQVTKRLEEGQPIGSFYLFETDGLDAVGALKFKDLNGDGVIDNNDRRYFGSALPTSYVGLNFGGAYKNFDFAVDTYGAMGGKVYNGKRAQRNGNENIEAEIGADFWTTLNTDSPNPAASNMIPVASDYYLESGDYFRINNITIGYTVPKFVKQVTSLRVYATALNPFIFQKYSGYSPEVNRDGSPMGGQGIELDAYPTLSSFVFGVNLKF
ncbi:MAG TPA: TonB-dependent receptor [Flavobacterium sp.]|nr:TonB-dependent receptor [Flavobacterium sp.]